MDLSAVNILLAVSFSVISVLATYLLFKSQDYSGKVLAYTSYVAAFWILMIFVYKSTGEIWGGSRLFTAKMQYVAGGLMLVLYAFFAYVWGIKDAKDIRRTKNLMAAGSVIWFFCSCLILFTGTMIKEVRISDDYGSLMVLGRYYSFYIYYFWFFAGIGYYYLVRKLLISKDKLERVQLIYVLSGSLIMGGVSFLANILMPLYGTQHLIWAGPLSVIIFTILTAYVIIRHHLFDIKVLVIELLVFTILIILFIEIFAAGSFQEIITRVVFFLVVSVLSLFLLKGIYKEVKQREKIEELAQQLSNFVSFVTHELRGPIAKFKWKLSTILGGNYGQLPPDIGKQIQYTFDLAVKMGQNIETFLSLDKLKVGKLELVKQEADLQDVVVDCLSEFEGRIKDKKIRVSFERNDSIPFVSVDKFQISHVINNLIDNAIKYTPEDGEINVEVRVDGNNMVFSIRDTGIGIPKNVLSDLFSQYERGAKEAKMFAVGSGIGLYLAKNIVELHGGKIWAESEGENRGSKFIFSLPIKGD